MSKDKVYMNAYMKARYAKRRKEAIIRLGGSCVDCGSLEELEIDHIDPSLKDFALSEGSSYSDARWNAELEKCQLLCKACHTAKHNSKFPCGTAQRFWRGCRCDGCRKAKNNYDKEYKKKWRINKKEQVAEGSKV